MNWFGESWGAPSCTPDTHVATPIGESCHYCEDPILEGECGLMIPNIVGDNEVSVRPYHFECFTRIVKGSVGHQKGTCPCNGGDEEDPPGMSFREAAKAAQEYYDTHQQTEEAAIRELARQFEQRGRAAGLDLSIAVIKVPGRAGTPAAPTTRERRRQEHKHGTRKEH